PDSLPHTCRLSLPRIVREVGSQPRCANAACCFAVTRYCTRELSGTRVLRMPAFTSLWRDRAGRAAPERGAPSRNKRTQGTRHVACLSLFSTAGTAALQGRF